MADAIPGKKKISWDDILFAYVALGFAKTFWTQPHLTVVASLVPLVVLSVSVFLSAFVLLSNERYLDATVDEALARAKTQEQRDVVEMSREGNKTILQNLGMRVVIGGEIVLRYAVSLVIILAVFWLALAAISGKWERFIEFWSVAMLSTAPLLFGVVLTFILRWLLLVPGEPLSLVMLVNQPDYSIVAHRFLTTLEPFSLFFVWLLATRLSTLHQESRGILFTLFVLVFVVVNLGWSLLGVHLGLGT